MIAYKNRRVSEAELRKILGVDDGDVSEVALQLFFGREAIFRAVYRHYNTPPIRTALQRFNELWVYPVALVIIPIRYLILGYGRVDEYSRLGGILQRLVGPLR